MIPASALLTALLDLHGALRPSGIPLVIGGGYGLYLRQLQLQAMPEPPRTLLDGRLWPLPRATEDLDLFLSTEIVADVGQMRALRAALDRLGYHVVEAARFFQFYKPVGDAGRVKVDLLTGPPPDEAAARRLHRRLPRVRPRERVELHAYLTREALDLFEAPVAVDVEGVLSSGEDYAARVHVPAPFPFLLMKLHALDDRLTDADKDLGRHHALDVYRIVALMSEGEYQAVVAQGARHRAHPAAQRAGDIVRRLFATDTGLGVLRLREHGLYRREFDHRLVAQVLREVFPA